MHPTATLLLLIHMSKSLAELMDMTGRMSLVTGAAGHLGKSIAHTLAELGSDVVLVDIHKDPINLLTLELESCYGVHAHSIPCDLESDSDIIELASDLRSNIGSIDVLINNAAFVGSNQLNGWSVCFERQSLDTWRRALEVNLTAPFTLVQSLKPLLDVSGNASVINIGSIYGVYGPDLSLYEGTTMNNPAAYAASKGGLLQLTRYLSTVLSPNIRVNSLSPGGLARNQPDSFVQKYTARTPLGRMGCEDDLKGAIAFLSSDLSSWVTGQNIIVDGGWGVW